MHGKVHHTAYLHRNHVANRCFLSEHHRRRIEVFRKREVRLQRWRFTIGTAFNILAEITPLIAMYVQATRFMTW